MCNGFYKTTCILVNGAKNRVGSVVVKVEDLRNLRVNGTILESLNSKDIRIR